MQGAETIVRPIAENPLNLFRDTAEYLNGSQPVDGLKYGYCSFENSDLAKSSFLNNPIIKPILTRLNPRLAITIKMPSWAYWLVALALLTQVTGCPPHPTNKNVSQAVIVGNSMAPSLLGKHQATICPNCRFKIISEVAGSTKPFVTCPNCGTHVTVDGTSSTEPADQVSIMIGQPPERWQVIGFQREGDDQASIKRVIGLPGETVWFEHGNVVVQTKDGNPTLLKKNWKQQQATRVLVHDNRFQDRSTRWSPLESTNRLNSLIPDQFQSDGRHWIRYQPKRCYEHSTSQTWSPRIEDSYGFNQSISRQLNLVNEVCLEFEFAPATSPPQASETELLIAIVAGRQTYLARFEFNADSVDVQLFDHDDQLTAVTRCKIDDDLPICGISNIDQQIIATVGDQQAHLLDLTVPHDDSPIELLLSLQPSNPDDLKRLRLWRDTHYFSPVSRDELLRRQADTGPDGYFVVGDNLPVSRDSRLWLQPKVKAKDVLGVVDIGQ